MITELYAWAKYEAKRSNVNIKQDEFNTCIRKLVQNQVNDDDLNLLYEPIKHIFEGSLKGRNDYKFEIKTSKGIKREINPDEMKYLMLPKQNLIGKAKQSIGGSIFSRNINKWIRELKGEYNEKKAERQTIRYCSIPEGNLKRIWQRRLLYTYFQSTEKFIGEEAICSFCGVKHEFKNLRFNPPVNIYVENITNYNSYLSNEPSYSICPYCSMLFLRIVVEEKGPMKIPFPKARQAYIYLLPYDPENEEIYKNIEIRRVEEFLKDEIRTEGLKFGELDALNTLLSLPVFIYKEVLPSSPTGILKPYVYIIFAQRTGQTEEISDYFVITRIDYLGKVGEKLYKGGRWNLDCLNFQRRLLSFIERFKGKQKINGFRLIFRFLGKMFSEGEVNFTFLRSILRREITQKKEKTILGGYGYLKAFLEVRKEAL